MPNATCHPTRKHNAKGLCLECYNEKIAVPRAREWYAANRERAAASSRERAKTHPEEMRAARKRASKMNPAKRAGYDRAWREKHPEKAFEVRKASRLAKYGLTLEDFAAMLKAQRGLCALCKRAPRSVGRFGLNVDHCHRTLRVRGLLCNMCNMIVGLVEKDADLLGRLERYL